MLSPGKKRGSGGGLHEENKAGVVEMTPEFNHTVRLWDPAEASAVASLTTRAPQLPGTHGRCVMSHPALCNCRGTEHLNEGMMHYVYQRGSCAGINHDHKSQRQNNVLRPSLNCCDLMQNKFIFHAIKDKESLKRFGFACLRPLLRVIQFQPYLRIIANPQYKSYHGIM